jgi:hypothetical protein
MQNQLSGEHRIAAVVNRAGTGNITAVSAQVGHKKQKL